MRELAEAASARYFSGGGFVGIGRTEDRNREVHGVEQVEELGAELNFHSPVDLEYLIRESIEGFAQRSKINVSLVISPNFERLAHNHELAIFRIVQECLTNSHRHSGGETAKIYLSQKDGVFRTRSAMKEKRYLRTSIRPQLRPHQRAWV